MDCAKCKNTGKVGKDAYCDCRHGEVQDRIDRARRKAERQKEKEERQREAARKKQQEKQLELLDEPKEDEIKLLFHVGDWVKFKGSPLRHPFEGVIIEVFPRNGQVTVDAKRFSDGSIARGQATVDQDRVELLPLDVRKNDLQAMIDIALDAKDHEWLKELSERIAAC